MAHAAHENDHAHHIVPQSLLLKVFGALIVLTVLTVAVAQVDLGILNVPLALAIAGAKAGLVVTFFMALKYDKGVNRLVFSVGIIFVVIFLAFTLLDTVFRGTVVDNVAETTIFLEERAAERLRAREPAPEALRVTPADFANTADTTAAGAAGTGAGEAAASDASDS